MNTNIKAVVTLIWSSVKVQYYCKDVHIPYERICQTSLELEYMMHKFRPDGYVTIQSRKNNPESIRFLQVKHSIKEMGYESLN